MAYRSVYLSPKIVRNSSSPPIKSSPTPANQPAVDDPPKASNPSKAASAPQTGKSPRPEPTNQSPGPKSPRESSFDENPQSIEPDSTASNTVQNPVQAHFVSNPIGASRADTDVQTEGPLDDYIDRLNAGTSRTCECSDEGRNLVVCIDGTSNEFGEKNTNVIELYSLVQKRKDDRQRTYYNSGIGTYARSSRRSLPKAISRKLDLAFARHFERIILDAYRWLSETYEDSDRIYLFGFSRGAYQVRVLSAMINKVGLIDRGNEKQIPFAYKWYTNPGSESEARKEPSSVEVPRTNDTPVDAQPTSWSQIHSATRFKEVFSRDVTVHFVGAWDTVSSVGLVRGRKLLPGTTDGMKHVCYFRHALALDERRVKFLPEYACGDAGSPQPAPDAQEKFSNTKEVWFAGTHSDVGGGNIENENLDSARPALRWMYSEASIAGLRFDLFRRKSTAGTNESDIKVHESLTGTWRLLEYLPILRLTYSPPTGSKSKDTTRRPHRGEARIIQHGQTIHPSVWLSEDLLEPYIPYACRHASNGTSPEVQFWSKMEFWRKLQGREDLEADGTTTNSWKEVDIYEVMGNLFAQYGSSARPEDKRQRTLLATMHTHARSEEGWRALSREVLQALNGPGDIQAANLCNILDILVKSAGPRSRTLEPGSYIITRRNLVPHLVSANKDQTRVAQGFLAKFTDPTARVIKHITAISVAFSPDGKHIAAGTEDRKVRIWDAESGQTVRKPFEGHNQAIRCIAFSPERPGSPQRIASACADQLVQIWDAESELGRMPGAPFLFGHTNVVNTVAFSPDGKRLASGSDDWTIRIWDVDSGQEVRPALNGHNDSGVLSVAFSPGAGKYLVSGGDDCAVRLWDAETMASVGTVGSGHNRSVWSVAFSPDGERIVSGSADWAVRIWDAHPDRGLVSLMLMKGHKSSVLCVAFAPNGSRVVSASNDKTIRFWDAKTGKIVGRPFKGHSEGVDSVAYSHDGMRVVSCSVLDRKRVASRV
ncbi:unnamed protein product [Peniophora sp. CBMAI 1063]|nr:unnamed protein product [Peniophora sp. CBMAI 1063]